MNLFIDTNVFLSFYHLSSDDLEELKKLSLLLKQAQITLYLPGQIINEFYRNRDNKIADALKHLIEHKFSPQFPQFCKGYEEYPVLRDLQKQYESKHKLLVNKITEDVKSRSLKADKTLEDLFQVGKQLEVTQDIIELARFRYDVGNPPGKNNSLGDAINWETLLKCIPKSQDLYFISDDKDYYSSLNANDFNTYLRDEWSELKDSSLHFYKRLSQFFKDHFPEINLASEQEKDILILDLNRSGSFTSTHAIIAKLSQYTNFTSDQLNDIALAFVTNRQISRIILDDDVKEFFSNVIRGNEERIRPDYVDIDELNSLKRKIDLDSQASQV